jgi:PleD family two-component response regulator
MHELILVVDPDTARLRRLREILSREGFSIMTATDRTTAIQICQRIPVQFVLGETYVLGFGADTSAVGETDDKSKSD